MNIQKKIEEIRQKPEHIRIRYVWGLVAISMVFILVVWVFSFWGRRTKEKINSEPLQVFNEFKEEKQSLDDYKDQFNELKNNLEQMGGGSQPADGETIPVEGE